MAIEEFWKQLLPPLKYLLIFYPVATALLTVIFGSILTYFAKRKDRNLDKRPYFSYLEYVLDYPIKEGFKGKGYLLLGDNGKKLFPIGSKSNQYNYASFMVIKNSSNNDILNVELVIDCSDSSKEKYITEKFILPVWKKDETIYIPQTIYGTGSLYSTNEELKITFNTITLEKLRFTYRRKIPILKYRIVKKSGFKFQLVKRPKSFYIEKYQKRYFFIWFTIFKNNIIGLTKVERVSNED